MADYVLSAKGTYDGSNFDSGIDKSKSKLDSFMEKASAIGEKVKSISVGAVSLVGGVGGAIGQLAATGGMARALNIEQAKTMFQGLKLEWKDYEDTIKKSVDGTAYSFDAAALVAANLAASGVGAGKDMDEALRGAVGVASTFNAELGDIGGLYQKIAAQGKVSGESIQQFAERGINITATLAKHLGKTEAEIKDMVKKGKIDFKTFSDAMNASFGDASAAANKTFTGSLSNMQAAIKRIGAKFADPIRENAIPVFNSLRLAFNAVSERLDPFVDRFSAFAGVFQGGFTSKVDAFTEALKNGASFMEALEAALGSAGSKVAAFIGVFGGIGVVAGALASVLSAVPGLGMLAGALGGGAASGKLFSTALGSIQGVAGFLFTLPAPVLAVVAAVMALAGGFAYLNSTNDEFRDKISGLVSQISGALMPLLANIGNTVVSLAAAILPIIQNLASQILPIIGQIIIIMAQLLAAILPIITTIAAAVLPTITVLAPLIAEVMAAIASAVLPIISAILSVIETVMPAILAIVTTVIDAIKTIITVAMAIINGDWEGAWSAIQSFFGGVWDNLVGIVSSGVDGVMQFISDIPGNIMSFFSNAGTWLIDAGKSIIQGLIDGIVGMASGVVDAIGGVLAQASAYMPHSPAKRGPFSGKGWTLYSGMAISQALGEGISRSAGAPIRALDSVMSDMAEIGFINDSLFAPIPYGAANDPRLGDETLGGDTYVQIHLSMGADAKAKNIVREIGREIKLHGLMR